MVNDENNTKGSEYKKFATPRIIGGVAIAVIILWALSIFFGPSDKQASKDTADKSQDSAVTTVAPHKDDHTTKAKDVDTSEKDNTTAHKSDANNEAETHDIPSTKKDVADSPGEQETSHVAGIAHDTGDLGEHETVPSMSSHQEETAEKHAEDVRQAITKSTSSDTRQAAESHGATTGHPMPETVHAPSHKPKPKGVAFVEAVIEPMQYELEERWWGWRANDLINITDNVESFQLGVLEVTRRTTVALAERISRTGTTDAFDEDLEQAMNWFMVKSSSYWFPSAESKYQDGLEELAAYLEKLKESKATFYTRTDNLIPLLASFENLLGSCDENLVKHNNEDGTPISFFVVDDYFYYTQGVASSMMVILNAIHHDFLLILESRNGTELLHHAILSCQKAVELDPWIVLDSNMSSLFANHRANMAASISHARFYLGQLIKTLST